MILPFIFGTLFFQFAHCHSSFLYNTKGETMPPSPSTLIPKSNSHSPTGRQMLAERCSTIRVCEPCRHRKRVCDGQRPCTHCSDESLECVYSVLSEHPRSVFSTMTARRLSSGSACETCRRRKTKCDGGSPCNFCATNGVECINNSERRKRSIAAAAAATAAATASQAAPIAPAAPPHSFVSAPTAPTSLMSPPTPATHVSDVAATSNSDAVEDDKTIDRIEDRLLRIEKLMSAFSPGAVSHSSLPSYREDKSILRRMSSATHHSSVPYPSLQQRHSIQGISPNREHVGFMPRTDRSSSSTHSISPPSSPLGMPKRSNSVAAAHPLTSSMFNLSLSPSSSTSSTSSGTRSTSPTTLSHKQTGWPVSPSDKQPFAFGDEWKHSSAPIPSWTDQLSKRTFTASTMDYTVHYPIYPLAQIQKHSSNA